MSIFKCKMCGGELEIETGESVAECTYCGAKQTLPKLDDEKRFNLYDRANHFRRNNEYDKAMGIYESILNEDRTDAEAYWSLVLCRYGIEYVEDPSSHKRIPTVNRTQFTSIFDDEDYKAALEYADYIQRPVYEAEAEAINEIQKGILAISQKEEPFDVFICYKETDANGRRTPDSVLANELYHELTNEGFKVFFARITLEDKLGIAYEPYIFAALNSAKVMVVLGTKAEYFNAVWVKNEWSRYLSLIKSGAKKVLIPAYRDMDPYDLPEEFSHLQAQDMGKLGFMPDLVRGIKKLAVDTPKAIVKETVVVNNTSQNTAPLLERTFLFLEDGKWNDANIYCEKVLDIDPRNAEAYLGKLMAELQVRIRERLADCAEPFDNRDNYSKVIRFGDDKLEAEMRSYIAHINERNETERLIGIYNTARKAMSAADSEKSFIDAAHLFHKIRGFENADTLAENCMSIAEDLKRQRLAKEEEAERLEYENLKKQLVAVDSSIKEIKSNIIKLQTELHSLGAFAFGKVKEIKNRICELNAMIEAEDLKKAVILSKQPLQTQLSFTPNTLVFGTYPQNRDGKDRTPIQWRVLAKESDKVFIISERAIDCRAYNTVSANVTWETCSLRKWMNGIFLKSAFTEEEQSRILNGEVTADTNRKSSVNPGNNTIDKVFLLSIAEVEKYFISDEDRKCVPTEYALAQGAYSSTNNTKGSSATCRWWLRTPGQYQNSAADIFGSGSVNFDGYFSIYDDACVRPAMWISID